MGLEAHASDLNPVAVLINKALIEIPPKFAGYPPVNPESRRRYLHKEWHGAEGLAEDIRYYGKWMRDEAWKRIGHLYPQVKLPKEYGGEEATVIAWLWTRTVKCPSPACGALMPLVRSFTLSTKKGKQAWVEPTINRADRTVRFSVRVDNSVPPEGTVNRRGARCIVCGIPVPFEHVRAEGKAGRMSVQLLAIVADTQSGRVYLSPIDEQAAIASNAIPLWKPDFELPHNPRDFKTPNYGMRTFADLFTARQLVSLSTFADLVSPASDRVHIDAIEASQHNSGIQPNSYDPSLTAYSNAIATYLGLAVSRSANTICSLAIWSQSRDQSVNVFSRQALPMNWDFPEVNPFASAAGDLGETSDSMSKTVAALPATVEGLVAQRDASVPGTFENNVVIATDPPYYDNIGYADLSDFFYVWLRRSLGQTQPGLFDTLLVPKAQELVATPYRFGNDHKQAKAFFEKGLGRAFTNMRLAEDANFPLTIFYAFKQAESDVESTSDERQTLEFASTGWETMLEGLVQAGLSIGGTWPMRTERPTGVKVALNALASSIVLVCRPRAADAVLTTRRDFLYTLKRELPKALRNLQRGNIAPVDLAQAAIGPGMAVFSRYNKVLESDGTSMRVRTALQLINQALDEVLAEQEGEYDADTRWAVAWFEQYGMEEGPYGIAETLSKAKNSAVGTLVEAGILKAQGGKVRLLHRNELSIDWNPATQKWLTVWEVTQRLIRSLQEEGDAGAATILEGVRTYGEVTRDLAYRLYTICERKKWADEALAYNSLVIEWSDINRVAERLGRTLTEQAPLFS